MNANHVFPVLLVCLAFSVVAPPVLTTEFNGIYKSLFFLGASNADKMCLDTQIRKSCILRLLWRFWDQLSTQTYFKSLTKRPSPKPATSQYSYDFVFTIATTCIKGEANCTSFKALPSARKLNWLGAMKPLMQLYLPKVLKWQVYRACNPASITGHTPISSLSWMVLKYVILSIFGLYTLLEIILTEKGPTMYLRLQR